jgi:hypothetical protein
MGGKPRFYWELAVSWGVNEKWVWRGFERGNGMGNLAANCANLRKFLTAKNARGFASRDGRNGRKGV